MGGVSSWGGGQVGLWTHCGTIVPQTQTNKSTLGPPLPPLPRTFTPGNANASLRHACHANTNAGRTQELPQAWLAGWLTTWQAPALASDTLIHTYSAFQLDLVDSQPIPGSSPAQPSPTLPSQEISWNSALEFFSHQEAFENWHNNQKTWTPDGNHFEQPFQ